MTWKVKRHGGRSTDEWKVRYDGAEERAREIYRKIRKELRQGTVLLLDDDDVERAKTSAPTLRSRW